MYHITCSITTYNVHTLHVIIITTYNVYNKFPGIFYVVEKRSLPLFSEEEIAEEKEKARELFHQVGELLGFN